MTDIVGLIPAAGGGTRLYPFSRAVPKEMYPIMGKAVIEHCIENLKVGGVKKIYMIVGFQKGALMDYIGDGSFYGVDVAYLYQLKRRGLGHGILQAKEWVNSPFIALLGDTFIEPKEEIKELIDLHRKERPIATVLLFQVDDPASYGVAKFRSIDGKGAGPVERLMEKPDKEQARGFETNGKYYAICGAYVFEPRIFDYIEKTPPGIKNEVQITDAIQLAIRGGERVFGLVLKGQYLDIGKWKTVLNVEKSMFSRYDIDHHIKERNEMMEKIIKHDEENGGQ
jgi:dTDP-glucose pyrophosphorylase